MTKYISNDFFLKFKAYTNFPSPLPGTLTFSLTSARRSCTLAVVATAITSSPTRLALPPVRTNEELRTQSTTSKVVRTLFLLCQRNKQNNK